MGVMSENINTKIYTYRVKKGKFKGKIVKSFESRHYIFGISSPLISCFDSEGNEYIIRCNELEDVKENDNNG